MDGRVKTLHPTIHGGILARRDLAAHLGAPAGRTASADIDLVVVNLYPFEATVAAGGRARACIENIDIGGPALIRAAAKNHEFVTVVIDPADYAAVIAEMTAQDGAHRPRAAPPPRRAPPMPAPPPMTPRSRRWMAAKEGEISRSALPSPASREQTLRYGENPHQQAAFYVAGENRARHRHGAPASGQGAVLQQPQRHRRRLSSWSPSSTGPRSPSSSTPIRAASPPAPISPPPMRRRWPAIRSALSAASSRSTAPLDAATAERSASFSRSHHRARLRR